MAVEEPGEGAASRRLFLVRHGESTWNASGLVQGQAALPRLTALGVRQAWRSARSVARSPIGALFSSDLPRATETARRFNALLGLPVVPEPRLRERALGVAEGMPISQLGPDRSGIDGGRVVDADVAPPGGESIRDLYRRATGFIEELFVQPMAGDLVVVCHGGVVRVVTAWLDGVAPEAMAWSPVDNGLVVARALRAPALAE